MALLAMPSSARLGIISCSGHEGILQISRLTTAPHTFRDVPSMQLGCARHADLIYKTNSSTDPAVMKAVDFHVFFGLPQENGLVPIVEPEVTSAIAKNNSRVVLTALLHSQQENGLVPIVEPEVTLGPGDYDIETTAFWSERVYSHVFRCSAVTPCLQPSAAALCTRRYHRSSSWRAVIDEDDNGCCSCALHYRMIITQQLRQSAAEQHRESCCTCQSGIMRCAGCSMSTMWCSTPSC